MNYQDMTKEQLIKEIEKLNKKLYHKKTGRLAWKKLMNGQMVKGQGFWSNGHFAFLDGIEKPEAINKLIGLYEKETEINFDTLIGDKQGKIQAMSDLTERGEYKDRLYSLDGISFQKQYIKMIDKLIPDFQLEVRGNLPAIIKRENKIVGLLMPMRGD